MAYRRSDREGSRSRDVAGATGEDGTNARVGLRWNRRALDLSEWITCRVCNNDSSKVCVVDPIRPEYSDLQCVRCGTTNPIDPVRRLIYGALARANSDQT